MVRRLAEAAAGLNALDEGIVVGVAEECDRKTRSRVRRRDGDAVEVRQPQIIRPSHH